MFHFIRGFFSILSPMISEAKLQMIDKVLCQRQDGDEDEVDPVQVVILVKEITHVLNYNGEGANEIQVCTEACLGHFLFDNGSY